MSLQPSGETLPTEIDEQVLKDITRYHNWHEDAQGNTRPLIEGWSDLKTFFDGEEDDRVLRIVVEHPGGDRPAQPEAIISLVTAIRKATAPEEVVVFPALPTSAAEAAEYIESCLQKIENGQSVWMVRDFHPLKGLILDYYADKKHRGFIQQEPDNNSHSAHIVMPDRSSESLTPPEGLSFDEAVKTLKDELSRGLVLPPEQSI